MIRTQTTGVKERRTALLGQTRRGKKLIAMAEKDLSPLSVQIVRGLNDKLYEKRKTAALEIER